MEKTFIGRVVAAGTGALAAPLAVMTAPGTASGGGPVIVEPTSSSAHIHSQKARTMSEPVTKTELEAHLKTIRAEAETVRVGVDSKLDQVIGAINGLKDKLHSDLQAVKDDNKNTRNLIAAVFIGTVLAALAALWATQANLLAAFQSGLTAHPVAEATETPNG